jgi:hypothetical protein
MCRSNVKLVCAVTILLAMASFPARADDATVKPTPNAEESAATKIRVILPAPWEPAPAQAGVTVNSPKQRSASR